MVTTDPEREQDSGASVVLVTGVSGAGKSSALKALEDLGYEAIDNVPISLIERLVSPDSPSHPIAIGVDIRTRDFDATAFLAEIGGLRRRADLDVRLAFLDCDDEILANRFKETRRRHPLAVDRPITDGIRQERELIASLREGADIVIDTSDMGPGDLKHSLETHFTGTGPTGLAVFVVSFGFRNGLPRDADLVFDVRFLRNPHYDLALRPLSGRDEAVADYIGADKDFQPFFDNLSRLIEPLLDRYAAEGKSYLTIAFGCTGGRHRSVFASERLGVWLRKLGHDPHIRHRDLDKPPK